MGPYLSLALVLGALGVILYHFFGRSSAAPAKPSLQPASPPASPEDERSGDASDSEVPQQDESRPNPLILVTAVGRTDPGRKRKHNEDSYLLLNEQALFVVADGMGRHAAGEVASQLAVETIEGLFQQGDFEGKPREGEGREAHRLRIAADRANAVVFEKANDVETYHGMGTTLVALHFSRSKERAAILHAGDSRCYRLRGHDLEQLTTDHTLGAAGITGSNAAVLSKALGIEEALEPEVTSIQPQPEDLFLLCSDGLSRMIDAEQIIETLTRNRDLDQAAASLIAQANEAGGRDNVTVLLIRVERARLADERRERNL